MIFLLKLKKKIRETALVAVFSYLIIVDFGFKNIAIIINNY